MENSNYWFYTLSAVPQTLAAMIALAATFVVFRVNTISKKIEESRNDLRRFMLLVTSILSKEDSSEIHEIEPLNHKDFLALYDKGLSKLDVKEKYLGLGEAKYKKYEDEMFRIINKEWYSYYPPDKERIFGYLNMKKEIFHKLLLEKDASQFWLNLSLILVSSTIIISMVILPNFTYFNGSKCVVGFVIFLATISILITSIGVWKIARTN